MLAKKRRNFCTHIVHVTIQLRLPW